MTTLLSAPTIITLDHAQSQADVTVNVDVEVDTVTDTRHPHVGGRVTLYGRPSPGAPTDMLLDLNIFPDDVTFDLGVIIGSHSVTGLSLVGGAGTIPVHVDANGDGLIPMGTLQFTVDGVLDGSDRRQYRSANAIPIPFHVDFVNKTFSLQGLTANFADGAATINLHGTIQNFPPVADAGPDQTVECTSPDGTPVMLDGTNSSDLDGNIMRTTWWAGAALDPDAFLGSGILGSGMTFTATAPLGITEYQISVSDQAFLTDADATTITVVDTTAPVINAPPDIAVECTAANGQAIDIGNATVNEACDSAPQLISDAPSLYVVGTTPIHWTATDASGNTGYATQYVTVQDTTPPSLSLSVTPSQIWPPNKTYVPVTVSALASDICSGAVSVTLISATATEPGGSQGVSTSAIQGAQIGTADFQFLVQADRSGNAPSGRLYTFTYDAVDANGNHTIKSVTVTVPHSSP